LRASIFAANSARTQPPWREDLRRARFRKLFPAEAIAVRLIRDLLRRSISGSVQ
jgi:hypothetical protein